MSICKLLSIDKVRGIAKVHDLLGKLFEYQQFDVLSVNSSRKGHAVYVIYSKRSSMQKIRKLSLLVPPRIVARPGTKKRDTDKATFV